MTTAATPFSPADQTDVARSWLDLLFRGEKLPDNLASNAPNLDAVATALHQALGIYSTGILVIAGLLLFYTLAIMVVQTAHYGVPLGRRSAQVWAPFRLLVAIGFLVPVSSGLNAGQYLVAWMAAQGSALASHVWQIAAYDMRGTFSTLAMPRGPDVRSFVAGGFEMEICRALYRRTFAAPDPTQVVRSAGDIEDIIKNSRTRYADETWLYTNQLHPNTPLCGAYRFANSRVADDGSETFKRLSNELADFSRAQAERLIMSAQGQADMNLALFLGETEGAGPQGDIISVATGIQTSLDDQLHKLIAGDPGIIDQALTESANAGWITAGHLMFQFARLQQMYGTLASHALPAVQPPALAEGEFMHPTIAEAIAANPSLRSLKAEQTTALTNFYVQLEQQVHAMRLWFYDKQLTDIPVAMSNPFDLRDQLNTSRDPESISSLFGHVLNDAAISYGVWNDKEGNTPYAVALSGDQPLLAIPAAMQSAVTALAEYGRRQAALGNYLFGMAGPDLAPAGTLAYSLLLGAVGLLFMASGFALMFLVPLLPFIRFFLGILAWLLSVIEAIIAIPVVALAHLNFSGEGLSGNAARHAYLLWLNILIRPALTLFGFLAGLLFFTLGIVFLGLIFQQLTLLVTPAQGDMFVTINVALTILYTLLVCAAANAAFKGITILPDLAFKWLGGFVMPEPVEVPAPGGNVAVAGGTVTGLPNISLHTPMGSQSPGIEKVFGADSRSIAEARNMGRKAALFPDYRGGEKPAVDTAKGAVQLEKTESQSKSGEAPKSITAVTQGAAPSAPSAINPERRDIQKPQQRRSTDFDTPLKKKESGSDGTTHPVREDKEPS